MIINGTITQAGQASEPTGQFAVRYQDICITDQGGQKWFGRIGSKQGYTTGVPISVTVEQKQGQDGTYNYFRRYTPQQPQQGRPQAAGGTTSAKEVDWDAKDLRNARMNGLNNATQLICLMAEMMKDSSVATIDNVKRVTSEYVDYIYNGLKRKPQGGQPNPDYVGEGGTEQQPPDDGIPF